MVFITDILSSRLTFELQQVFEERSNAQQQN